MNLIVVGGILFLAVIPLHFVKLVFREPAGHIGAPYGLAAALVYTLASFTSLVCIHAGPVLFCVGLLFLLLGVEK